MDEDEYNNLVKARVERAEARDLVRMMYIIIMSLPNGSVSLERHLAGDELPAWVTERPRRVRTSKPD